MSIRPSAASETRALVEALAAADLVKRESAIARLAVIGGRAVDRLAAVYADPATGRDTRVAILRVLESVGDARGIPIARRGLQEGGDVAVAAAASLRTLLDSTSADVSASALDALVSTALDRGGERRVRQAAFEALQDMPKDVQERVAAALVDDPDAAVKTRAASSPGEGSGDATWQDALEGHLPDDPAAFRDAAQTRAPSAALSTLQKLVDATRKRETDAGDASRAQKWRDVRGALHQSLALRGSKVAVYDLRETLTAADAPLPATYVAALQVIGDESCLEPIAAAFSRAATDERWRHQLAAAFQAIVTREKIARNSSAVKRIAARWPDAAAALSKPSRTTPRRKPPART